MQSLWTGIQCQSVLNDANWSPGNLAHASAAGDALMQGASNLLWRKEFLGNLEPALPETPTIHERVHNTDRKLRMELCAERLCGL